MEPGAGRDESFTAAIDGLEAIVARCRAAAARAGFFAALYLAVTRTVRDRAAAGRFADRRRMERFASRFANHYLDAHDRWRAGASPAASWSAAFAATGRWRPIVLQHLLLGINAHINLDLGVTAATIADDDGGTPAALAAARGDFDVVNDVLAELVGACLAALASVSPWIGLADRVSGTHDEALINFSLRAARRDAWRLAERLAAHPQAARAPIVAAADAGAARVAAAIAHPGFWPSTLLLVVRSRERRPVADVIDVLAAIRG